MNLMYFCFASRIQSGRPLTNRVEIILDSKKKGKQRAHPNIEIQTQAQAPYRNTRSRSHSAEPTTTSRQAVLRKNTATRRGMQPIGEDEEDVDSSANDSDEDEVAELIDGQNGKLYPPISMYELRLADVSYGCIRRTIPHASKPKRRRPPNLPPSLPFPSSISAHGQSPYPQPRPQAQHHRRPSIRRRNISVTEHESAPGARRTDRRGEEEAL